MILMLQKEVIERIVSKPNTKAYGRLSVLCQAFYECEKLFDVSKGSFFPAPNVTSSVIKMKRKDVIYSPEKLKMLSEKLFSNRRKMLKNTLLSLNIQREDLFHKRAEDLSVNEIIGLLYP
jgi:16S rRNA (adenine1518-N6/adenine1519-N6)-dimethyltransferase